MFAHPEYTFQLEKLLSCINETDPAQDRKVAVEFRNKSWYHEDVYDLLDFYKAAMVIQDIPKSATPLINHKSDFVYLRFHGPTGNYRESYSEYFLREYATLIKEWIENIGTGTDLRFVLAGTGWHFTLLIDQPPKPFRHIPFFEKVKFRNLEISRPCS